MTLCLKQAMISVAIENNNPIAEVIASVADNAIAWEWSVYCVQCWQSGRHPLL